MTTSSWIRHLSRASEPNRNMFQTEFHCDHAPQNWDAITGSLGASHFLAAGWAAYRRQAEGGTPVFILARAQDGRPTAAALGYIEQSSRPGLSLLTRKLVFQSHPLLDESSGIDATWFLLEIERFARSHGCVEIVIWSYFSGESRLNIVAQGFQEESRIEFHVDVHQPLDAIWSRIHAEQQEKIRRAQKKGLEVQIVNTLQGFLHLRDLQFATKQRKDEMGQAFDLKSDDSHYALMAAALGGRGLSQLFLAFNNGKPISTILFGSFNGRAYSIYSASNSEGYKLSAPSFLYWKAVEYFHNHGYSLLNRGGVPAEAQNEGHPAHGVYYYKSRLGAELRICKGGNKILHPLRIRLHKTLKQISKRWVSQSN